MLAGVSDIGIYVTKYYLPHEELAKARGIPKEKYHIGLGNQNMAIIPNWEDAVTMAAKGPCRNDNEDGPRHRQIDDAVKEARSG